MFTWAIGAAVARFPDTEEVAGSIPVSPTRKAPGYLGLLFLSYSTYNIGAHSQSGDLD